MTAIRTALMHAVLAQTHPDAGDMSVPFDERVDRQVDEWWWGTRLESHLLADHALIALRALRCIDSRTLSLVVRRVAEEGASLANVLPHLLHDHGIPVDKLPRFTVEAEVATGLETLLRESGLEVLPARPVDQRQDRRLVWLEEAKQQGTLDHTHTAFWSYVATANVHRLPLTHPLVLEVRELVRRLPRKSAQATERTPST